MPYIITVCILVILGITTPFLKQKTAFSTPEPIATQETITVSTDSQQTTDDSVDDEPDEDTEDNEDEPEENTVRDDNPSPSDNTEQVQPVTTNTTPTAPAVLSTYSDGTYSSSKTYRTPDGTYTMDVRITVANDTVTSAAVQFDSKGSRDNYTKKFTNAYQSTVIGKDLETVSPSRIGGASLTTRAFNSALDSIRSQAS